MKDMHRATVFSPPRMRYRVHAPLFGPTISKTVSGTVDSALLQTRGRPRLSKEVDSAANMYWRLEISTGSSGAAGAYEARKNGERLALVAPPTMVSSSASVILLKISLYAR